MDYTYDYNAIISQMKNDVDFSRDYYAISEKEDTYDVTETEYTNDYFSKDASSYEYAEVSAEKPDKTGKKVQDLESNLNYLMTSYKKMRKQLSLYSGLETEQELSSGSTEVYKLPNKEEASYDILKNYKYNYYDET